MSEHLIGQEQRYLRKMDYQRLQTLQADTGMRQSIGGRPDDAAPYLRRGNVIALGEWNLSSIGGTVTLSADPIAWQHEQSSAMVIDWRAAANHLLSSAGIVAPSVEIAALADHHVAALRRRVTPAMPQIGVIDG